MLYLLIRKKIAAKVIFRVNYKRPDTAGVYRSDMAIHALSTPARCLFQEGGGMLAPTHGRLQDVWAADAERFNERDDVRMRRAFLLENVFARAPANAKAFLTGLAGRPANTKTENLMLAGCPANAKTENLVLAGCPASIKTENLVLAGFPQMPKLKI